ncbi:hypothetical protein RvY_13509-1 [Ramazzottius varieornatus]|uniref:IPT/TIG domain-containing protein n=1 Tax=Ramazzottius varieornatus TaxID=947166 RepID=A0A1D1VWM6_RAMVA|nr:hypothetical protein RvY_13509-1 [Ramazzottius varieornatus]
MFKSLSEMLTEQATADDPLSIIHSTKSKHFDRERSPVILNVQPIRVSTLGNTPVTIVGYNLGKDPDDVAHLFICGQDCVEGIEYVSSTKLKCRVKRWVPCRGVVTLYTKSGGKGVACQLLEVFDSLYGDAEEKPDDETSHLVALQQLEANEAALTMENTKCIVRINGLEEHNREAKAYVRRLQSLPPAEKFPSQRRSSFYSGR